jgi:hypothetical protein
VYALFPVLLTFFTCIPEVLFCEGVKENYEHALDFALQFPFGGKLLCHRVITINPAIITSDNPKQAGCIVGGDLMKLLADVDTQLLLISCQKSHQARYTTPNKMI